jgi:hypothetical protein
MSKESEGKRGVDFWGFGEPLATLHRYVIADNKMRIRLDKSLANTDGRIQ